MTEIIISLFDTYYGRVLKADSKLRYIHAFFRRYIFRQGIKSTFFLIPPTLTFIYSFFNVMHYIEICAIILLN